MLCFDFFFVPPRFSFSVSDTQYLLTFLVMFVAAVIISQLTMRIRAQAEAARLGEMRAPPCSRLSRRLASTRGIAPILEVALSHIEQVFDSDVIGLLPDRDGRLEVQVRVGRQAGPG